MKKNIFKKLTEFGINEVNKQEITKDIFGSAIRDSAVQGSVESNSNDEFENNAEELMQKWCTLRNSEAQFSEYFRLHKLQHIRNCMTAELRAMVGPGFPPKPYTQNANECINSVVTRGKETRSLSLKSIVQLLRSVVKDQEEQVKLSFIGSGEWTLGKEYDQFQERVEQFYQMTHWQRNQLIEKFNSLPVKGATLPMKELSVTPQNCMLLYPPFSIIEDMFAKAAEILNSSAVIPAPGTPAGTFVVQNLISPMEPLVVIIKNNFKICCQAKCKQYHAYQICEHCLPVAKKESVLINFLAYHKKRNTSKHKQMQISDIAEVGKDRRCGKKATKATSKRYGKSNK